MTSDLVGRRILEIATTCHSIAKLNTRTVNAEKNPMTSRVRSFIALYDDMEPEELLEMARTFYKNFYIDAIEDDSVGDWLEGDVALLLGEGDCEIKLKLDNYYRIAKDVDSSLKTKWRSQLKFDILSLLTSIASPVVKEKLDSKLSHIGAQIGKTAATTSHGLGGSAGSAALGDFGSMISNMFTNFNDTINKAPQVKNMMKNPEAQAMMRMLSSSAPDQLKNTMESAINDLSEGKLDFSKTFGEIASKLMDTISVEDDEPGESSNGTSLLTLPSSLHPHTSSSELQVMSEEPGEEACNGEVCNGEVCHIHN
jgi:flagellar hook-basal body complex protein FliE